MRKIYTTILVIGLVSIFSMVVLAQGKGNRQNNSPRVKKVNQTANDNSTNRQTNAPPRSDGMTYQKITPCNQLKGDDLRAKNRQCKLPNGQIITVGVYCEDYDSYACKQSNGNTQNRNGKAGSEDIMARPNTNIQSSETEGLRNSTVGNRRNERANKNAPNGTTEANPPADNGQNRGRATLGQTVDGKANPRNNRQGNKRANQSPNGGTQMLDDQELQDFKSNKPKGQFGGTTFEGTDIARTNAPVKPLNKPRRGNGRNAPANTNGEANPPAANQSSQAASQGKTNNTELQETRYDFIYPNQPSDIVTWNENSGSYGYTTANSGWEFIQTSAGIAVRRRGQEGTVVAHTKCNDTANYTFGYGGNNGSIDMIMCRPKTEGLPRLKPSIQIVPKSQQ